MGLWLTHFLLQNIGKIPTLFPQVFPAPFAGAEAKIIF
jgi:hypothetical protein